MEALMYINLISTFFEENKLIHSRPKRIEKCFNYVMNNGNYNSVPKVRDLVKEKISNMEGTFMMKWRGSNYDALERFKEENVKWIHNTLQLPSSAESNSRTGRPKKDSFEGLSERSKNRRAADLTEHDLGELLLASVQAAKKEGKSDLSYVLRLLYKDHETAKKIRVLIKSEKMLARKPKPKKISPLRALIHLLDNRFTKMQYTNTRLLSKENNGDIYPAYNHVREAKKECRPPPECFMINDVCASLSLQPLLDHTASRLLHLQEETIESLQVENNEITIKLQGKWGGDGSSNQSQFNVKYENVEFKDNSDANLFATTFVPLRMTTNNGQIVWNNATPQSPRWCRPLRLQFVKETPEFTLKEIESVKEEIETLIPFTATIAGKKVTVIYELYLTMIDGKVFNVITKVPSQVCGICNATPKQFNNLTNMSIRFKPKEGTLNYGVSVLHLRIRSFEWLLHISYRLTLTKKTWQVRGLINKQVVEKRKIYLQKKFWKKMSLRVDFPAKGGSGNSNNGPVARRAFSDPKLLAEVLDLNVDLVKRVSTILIALSCQLPLDTVLFPSFCDETAILYVQTYEWFPMPPSVHKILIHSRDLVLANDLPLGVLAEDAAESCNKLYRHNRQFHARTGSRQQNLTDVFNRALDTSDPIVSSFSLQKRLYSRHRKPLPAEVLRLLKPADAPAATASEVGETSLLDDEEDDAEGGDFLDDEIIDELDALCLQPDPMYEDDDEDDHDDDIEDD